MSTSASASGGRAAAVPVPGCESLVFVAAALDDNLRCQICLEACMEATTACGEGHTFCGPCLQEMSARGDEKCPTCRADRINLPNRPLRDMIDALRVRCCEGEGEEGAPKRSRTEGENSGDNGHNGCTWEGTLGQWKDEHKKVCPYVDVRCPFNCSKLVRRMDVGQHMVECPLRKVECGACNAMVEHDKLEHHGKNACPKALVKCEFCNEEMTRETLGKTASRYRQPQEHFPGVDPEPKLALGAEPWYTGHLAECPKAILCCEFASRGCDAKFAREDAAAHHAEKAQYHAALVNQTLTRLYFWLDWDFVQICWPIHRERIAGSRNLVIESRAVDSLSCYELFLKLHLRGPSDPIEVGICSKSISCYPTHPHVRLKKINVKVADTSLNWPTEYAEVDMEEEKQINPPRGEPGVFEFKTTVKKSNGDDFTRADLLDSFDDGYDGRCTIRARFCIHKQSSVILYTNTEE